MVEDGIKMDLREVDWEYMGWVHVAQDRDKCRGVVNAVMNPGGGGLAEDLSASQKGVLRGVNKQRELTKECVRECTRWFKYDRD